jgi:hypothetical protein
MHASLVRSQADLQAGKRAVEKPCWRDYETCLTSVLLKNLITQKAIAFLCPTQLTSAIIN